MISGTDSGAENQVSFRDEDDAKIGTDSWPCSGPIGMLYSL